MIPRLPLKILCIIVFTTSSLLFYSGYTLQRRALHAMQNALAPLNTDYNEYLSSKEPSSSTYDASQLPFSLPNADKTAYVQLVNTATELCHAMVVFKALKEKGARKGGGKGKVMLVLYPKEWESGILRVGVSRDSESKGGEKEPVRMGEENWVEVRRLLKLAAYMGISARGVVDILPGKLKIPQHQRINPLHLLTLPYTRVLLLSPTSLIQSTLDPLLDASTLLQFSFASPRYGSDRLHDNFLLCTPSLAGLKQIEQYLDTHHPRSSGKDSISPMEAVNRVLGETSMVLPGDPYFYSTDHLLGSSSPEEEGFEEKVKNSMVITFSEEDEKPWIVKLDKVNKGEKKICKDGVLDCEERLRVWKDLRERFEEGRRAVCGWDWEFVNGD